MASGEREGTFRDDKTGELYLLPTQRPDGSWRRPRKVKDGYVPQEEVATYESKGTRFNKNKPSLPPGLVPGQEPPKQAAQTTKSNIDTSGMSKSAKKNLKRKEKKKTQKEEEDNRKVSGPYMDRLADDMSAATISSGDKTNEKPEEFKRLRALRKKLKDIDKLQQRIDSGELKNPEKEQLEKLSKRPTIVDEITDLEAVCGE